MPVDNKKEFELITEYVAGLNGFIVFVLLNAVDPPPIAAYFEITFPCCSPNKKIEYGDVLPIWAKDSVTTNNKNNVLINLYIKI